MYCRLNMELNLQNLFGLHLYSCGPVLQIGLSYRPTRLHRLAESIPGLLKRLQIRALFCMQLDLNYVTGLWLLCPSFSYLLLWKPSAWFLYWYTRWCSLVQCSGSVTFWYGSGSCFGSRNLRQWPSRWQTKFFCFVVDSWYFASDPDLRIYWVRIWILLFTSVAFKMSTKKFFSWFFCLFLFEGHSHHSSKIKRHKEVTKQYINQGFFLLFLVDDRRRSGSGSVPLTNESTSRSGRPENLRILRIWNTASPCNAVLLGTFPLVKISERIYGENRPTGKCSVRSTVEKKHVADRPIVS